MAERTDIMKKSEWIKELETLVEERFDPAEVDGFENSAPEIKLAILSDLYDNEPLNIETTKELAYDELANTYSTMVAWN